MPAELLNRLESSIPRIEASIAYEKIGSAMNTDRSRPLDPLDSEIRAMKFIWNLPIISLDYLYEDERRCGLCEKKYDSEFKVCGRGESPCSLPCGHIAGHHCLRKHLSPFENGFTRCPFCKVDFPQLFTDPLQPLQPISEPAWEDLDDHEESNKELSREISQLSRDTGASSAEIKRFLSIDEVIERSRRQTEVSDVATTGSEVQDFAIQDNDPAKIGKGEFPKNRKNAASPIFARAAMKAVDLLARRF